MREPDFADARRVLVERDLRGHGVSDEAVLKAFADVPRERFVSAAQQGAAYDNLPLPIGLGQTISQPLIVAIMCEALKLSPDARVLEIGTGSGYAAAILARLAREVFTIERHAELAGTARERLAELGYENVHVRHGDGTLGWPEAAPFNGIVVAASGTTIPTALLRQLTIGGRLVIPVGEHGGAQQLKCVTRRGEDEFETEDLGPVRFVPLIAGADADE